MRITDIGPLRLSAQHIVGEKFTLPEDAVKQLLAMQAQDYTGALWSIGLRTKDSTQADVEKAIRDRRIVRTWPMRGTLHFLHADDIHWMVDLLASRATAAAKSRRINQLGLTDAIVDEAEKVLRAELHGGKSIARNHIIDMFRDGIKGIEIDTQHVQHLLRYFGERGVICFGPHIGKQPTFVLLDEWIPKTVEKPRHDALAELARRYFASHGPATLKDFAGWAMLTMHDARQGLLLAKGDLQESIIDATAYYYAPGLKPVEASDTVLLPGFDEYILGYKDRSAVLETLHSQKIVPGNNGMFLPTIVHNGRVIGVWKRRLNKTTVIFHYDLFSDEDKMAADYAEARYTAFVLS